jgi:hypothetical protein
MLQAHRAAAAREGAQQSSMREEAKRSTAASFGKVQHAAPAKPLEANLKILSDMGFADANENRQALTKFGNDIHQAMDELVRRQEQREQSAHLHPQVLVQLNLEVELDEEEADGEEARNMKGEKEIELAEQTRRQQEIEREEDNVLESLFPGVFSCRSRGPALPQS